MIAKIKITTFMLLLLAMNQLCTAETIVFKSGKTENLTILERTDSCIKVDLHGIPIKYYLDEIESIDGAKLTPEPKKEIARKASKDTFPVKYRKFTINYSPTLYTGNIQVDIEGNPVADDQLIKDAIGAVERVLKVSRLDMFHQARIEVVRMLENNTVVIEKWDIEGKDYRKEIWLKYDSTPPPGFPMKIMIMASEEEIFN